MMEDNAEIKAWSCVLNSTYVHMWTSVTQGPTQDSIDASECVYIRFAAQLGIFVQDV
ncbi:unnamed protein product [Penicillium roqueforti FM164]|uniref:Uncharacterized protein n=1 Tax=Penicillium roqueforti (strain FM164) TaxID=1365484 RepID=W6QJN7_PENRF|nr:unnamed protein product [Penicillium roqueforti FM164]